MEFIEYFEENSKKFSDVPALRSVTNKKGITYGQLNQMSASVYAYLKKKGIGREQMVFICLPRDIGIVVAMLGVIKAGAAFVLCEDTYPRDRVEFMKKDCGSILTIDDKIFAEMLAETPLYGHEKTSPHDACYAVYTSGSTGNPKGVLHEYGKLMQMVESHVNISPRLPLGANHALSAPFNFLAAVILVLRTTYDGLCLYILSYDIAKNVTKLSEFLKNEDVKEAFLSMSILKLCKDDLYEGLIHVFCGGEPCNNICLPKGVRFDGTYGSSETAFVLATFKIEKAYDKAPAGKNSIGVEILILDDDGHRLPNGQIGEICCKNEFTRGYINLPEKTAEAFAGGVYHMGDLGYIGEDGNLFVCGRKDDMIKIDGNRIEPAEIEAVIKKELGLSNVVAKGFQAEKRSFICVYFLEKELKEKNLLKENGSLVISKSELRNRLSEKLPYYMLPSYYLILPSFPVNANGKLAKNELNMPDVGSYQAEYVAPSNEMEEKLCNVIASVLGIERIGVEDDFYEIGGDSVSTIKVISQLNLDQLDVNIFLAGRTPAKIAKLYEEAAKSETENLEERNTQAQKKDHPLLPEQIFMFNYQCNYPNLIMWNVSVLLRFEPDTDIENLKKAVDTVLASHPVFSIVFTRKNEELVQRFNPDIVFDTEIEEISEAEFEIRKKELVQPFTLLDKLLYRAKLFKTEEGGYLFFDAHHCIIDGTSLYIFLDDICKAYEGKPLEPDYYFAVFEDRHKQIHSLLYEEGRQYYERVLRDKEWDDCLLPDFETKENSHGDMTVKIPIDEELFEKIYKIYNVGKNSFFIAVACIAIAIYNKKRNILISWVYNGRESVRDNHVIGVLLQAMFVGISVDDKLTFEGLYKDVYNQVNNDIRYLCYPYPGVEHFIEDYYDASVNYHPNFASIYEKNSLKFIAVECPSSLNRACPNLLDIHIFETDNGCELCMDYNASAYKKESIERFSKMFIKTACLLAQNADNPDMHVMDIMKRIK